MIERVQDNPIPYRLNEVYFIQMFNAWTVDGSSSGYTAFKNGRSLGYGFKIKRHDLKK